MVALLFVMQAVATNLVVERQNGSTMQQNIALIGKWVFVGEDLQLMDKEGNVLATEPINSVRKIIFSDQPTAIENVKQEVIVVYPNPVQDVLYINGIVDQTLRVYDMQGRMVQITEGTQVTVSNLSKGTYLLQIGTQVVRFIKL